MTRYQMMLGMAAIGLAAGAAAGDDFGQPLKEPRSELIIHKVQREKLSFDIYERGTLEAAESLDIICRVRTARAITLTLLWVVEDGARVKQGDVLAKIDDSPLQDQLMAQKITVQAAEGAAVAAQENARSVRIQSESDVESAKIALHLAELDLKKFVEGDYPQSLKDLRGRKLVAESDLQVLREQAEAAERLVRNGTLTAEEARARRFRLLNAEVALDKVNEELRVLENYAKVRTVTDLTSRLDVAKQTLERVKVQAEAKRIQAESDRTTKASILQLEQAKYQDIEEQIRRCVITAPRAGLVVHYVAEQARPGMQPIIAPGEPVREGQKLFRMPDLSQIVVSFRVFEAAITRVRVGQAALVRVDAFPGRELRGKVRQVSTVPALEDWRSADVKTYPVQVALDEPVDGLKPHMSAEVVLATGQAVENVLAVPVQALLPPTAAGQRLCVVRMPTGLEQREVVLGPSNGKMTEIRSGLKEGEEVVVNPRSLYVERPDRR